MATLGAKAQKGVGSAGWIVAEKENVLQLLNQEMEEIEYPARHEMEWLNEHMAEIFSKNQFNVTEIFKTPGKLRGKTPRTGKKHNVRGTRVPLSDMFSSGPYIRNSPALYTSTNQQIAKVVPNVQSEEAAQNQNSNPQYNTDSGYHGMPGDDDMELIYSDTQQEIETATQLLDESTIIPRNPSGSRNLSTSLDRRTTEGSFHSAREVARSKETTVEPPEMDSCQYGHAAGQERTEHNAEHLVEIPGHISGSPTAAQMQSEGTKVAEIQHRERDTVLDHPFDDIGSPSDGSTPDRPLIRKSSLTFASLPAREPLTTKKSMGGATISRTSHVDPSKVNLSGHGGYVGRMTGGVRLTQVLPEEYSERMGVGDKEVVHVHEDSDADVKATKLHNKSSTQLLHERINMLGKSQPSRLTKSIPSVNMTLTQPSHPELPPPKPEPVCDGEQKVAVQEAGTDDWIKPFRSSTRMQRPQCARGNTAEVMEPSQREGDIAKPDREDIAKPKFRQGSPGRSSPKSKGFNPSENFHGKSASTSVLISPRSAAAVAVQRPVSVSDSLRETTTPISSPKRYEGPLSASKSRLQSIMKTAKGLFTSSAGISAAAKLEALSPSATLSQASLYPSLSGILEQQTSLQSLSSSLEKQDGPRTRSSTEREEKRRDKELRDRQRMKEQLEKAREQERQKASQFKSTYNQRQLENTAHVYPTKAPVTRTSPRKIAQPQNSVVGDMEPSRNEEAKFAIPALPQHHQKQNESRRPVRPTRDTRKPKPQPVSIRIGTHSQRIPLTAASLSSNVHDPAQNPPAAPKQPAVSKKPSNASLHTTASTNSFKSSTSSLASKPKAASTAERRKEQEERENQRKLEVRREAERKRATQQEEARRQEQIDRAEAERRERERERLASDDPRKIAQKQAIEKRRLENARKLEQQRSRQPTPLNELNSIIHQEKSCLSASQRGDPGGQRPPSRLNTPQPPSRQVNNLPNQAKPSKRVLEEEPVSRPVGGTVGMAHQTDAKRRKTDGEPVPDLPVRPTMAPPIRQSNVRKEGNKPQGLAHGYSTSQPPQVHNQSAPSLFKNPPAAPRHFQYPAPQQPHRNGHPLEMAKYVSGKIPFAEASNPPLPAHKTPSSGQQKILKSSPVYPNGENIKLPEIPTDSEDEDSDTERYNLPEWAKDENLANILVDQEGKDGERVFGPSAPLQMEDIFRDNKDRMWRFRDRTSSANWAGPDGLTQDEIKWDIAERERLKRNGGWMFQT